MDNTNEVLLGGRMINATDLNGKSSEIKVKKVSHLKGSNLIASYEDDLQFAMMVTGFSESELEKFSEESFYNIVDTGHEINEKTISRALDSRAKKLSNPKYQSYLKEASSLTSFLQESPDEN